MRNATWLFSLLLLVFSTLSHAEQSQAFGDYVVHYNALMTDTLTPQIAKAYGIQRSKQRGMMNITVLKNMLGAPGQPVAATVSVNATNLSNQLRKLDVREVREGNAIYYIAEFGVNDGDTLDFAIQVKPENGDSAHEIKLRQKFYTR